MTLFGSATFRRIWNSPTFNTWLSYSTKALSLFVVLPLILKKFTEAEVALWYLFATIIALQGLADMGFRSTFIRIISYAMGGATDVAIYNKTESEIENAEPNWALLTEILSVMRRIYVVLSVIFFTLLATIGSWSMLKTVNAVTNINQAWIGWMIIVVVSSVKLYATIFSNYLEGLNKIALVRRWESLTSILSIMLSILFLLIFKSLLSLIIANQVGVLIDVFRNYQLSLHVENAKIKTLAITNKFDKVLFRKIWQPAWRSGLSGFMSNGLNSITTIIYAQIGTTSHVASYLLALRLMGQIRDISMAPFYSKIPLFARLNSQYKKNELFKSAQRGMFLSNLVFILAAISVGIFANWLLKTMGSDVKFISPSLWVLITLAYFIYRFGAMHIQLYNTTNHIISHIADGVSGIIYIIVTFALIKRWELYAIPIGMISGYLGFYAWYAAYHSYKFLNTKMFTFEKRASLPALSILVVYISIWYLIYR